MQSDNNDLVEKFEKMIHSDSSIFLDTDEIEEIILYYFNDGDISMAQKAIDLGNSLYPKSINISILHSEILLLKGNLNESYELIENLLEFNHNSQDLVFQKAKILNKMKKYMDSISILKNITYSDQLNFFILDLLLKNYMNVEDYDNSIEILIKILVLYPDDKNYFDKLISCFNLSSKEDEAIDFLNDYLEKNPYSANAWFEIGKLYFKKNKIKESIAAHEFGVISDESFSSCYIELGKIYEKKEEYKKSIYYYKIVNNLNKDSSFSLYRLSRCYEKIGDYDNALKYLNVIIEKDPLYEKAWISIAKYYLRKNDHDKAIENLNKALNIISNNY
tara:strand:- start:252 stop:1250 length:999 start_codon:yes stop_codon:yes gene_type:complete